VESVDICVSLLPKINGIAFHSYTLNSSNLCSSNCKSVQLQFTTMQCYMFQNFVCVSPLKISSKADRLLACAIPANFHYVNALLVPTSPLKRPVITVSGVAKNVNWGASAPLPLLTGV